MKKYQVMAAALTAATSLTTLLSGCGGNSQDSSGENTNNTSQNTAQSQDISSSSDVTTVKISYPVLSVVPSEEGTKQVEDSINQYLEEKGEDVRIDLDPIDGNSYTTQVDMQIVSGDDIDIYLPMDGLNMAVQNNKVLPLDDYLDNELAGAVEVMGEEFLGNCIYGGQTYGIPCYKGNVLIYYWVCRKDVFDNLGIDRASITNVRDLDEVLAKIHEQYPDMDAIAPAIGVNGAGNNFQLARVLAGVDDYEVSNLNNGLCVVGNDMTVQNMYATDYFKEACQIAYEWNQSGYVSDDASVATDTPSDMMAAGRAASMIIGYAYDVESVEATTLNGGSPFESVAIPISKDMLSPIPLTWSIAYTCENPSAAAKVLNMLYTDEFVLNSVIFGVEDVDWVDAGTGDGSILWPEGKNMETVPYTAALSCGIMGNQFIMYSMDGITKASDIPFMADNMENTKKSPVFGFTVNVENIKSQVSAVSNVIAQYEGGLYTGELDPEVYIPKFLEELDAAGMSTMLPEAQTQLDGWLKK